MTTIQYMHIFKIRIIFHVKKNKKNTTVMPYYFDSIINIL